MDNGFSLDSGFSNGDNLNWQYDGADQNYPWTPITYRVQAIASFAVQVVMFM